MKHALLILAASLAFSLPAHAQNCFADYKAKQDEPLRLHYGVAQISGECSKAAAQAQLGPRLSAQGWTLLTIVSTFGPEGLNERKQRAGSNYLRF